MSTSLNRISWVDAAKGFAMLLIMWGHVMHGGGILRYGLHHSMCLFILF